MKNYKYTVSQIIGLIAENYKEYKKQKVTDSEVYTNTCANLIILLTKPSCRDKKRYDLVVEIKDILFSLEHSLCTGKEFVDNAIRKSLLISALKLLSEEV